MTRRLQTDAEKLEEIREWYGRHRNDYNPVGPNEPPKVWAEYFGWLLQRCLEAADRDQVRS